MINFELRFQTPSLFECGDDKCFTAKGIAGHLFNTAFDNVRMNITWRMVSLDNSQLQDYGHCVRDDCTGLTKRIIDWDIDLIAMPMAYDVHNFTDINTWPFVVDTPAYEEHYGIASSYHARNDALQDVDVTQSFDNFRVEVVALVILLIATIYYITLKARMVLLCSRGRSHCLWDMISGLLGNCSFEESNYAALKGLTICYVVLVFYVTQYYCGYFRTDLVEPRPVFKINSLEDLVVDPEQRLPLFVAADSSVTFFTRGKTRYHALLWQRHQRNRMYKKVENVIVVEDATAFQKVVELVTQHVGAFIGPVMVVRMSKIYYCSLMYDRGGNYYVAKNDHDRTMVGFTMMKKTMPEVRRRAHRQLMRFFEALLVKRWMNDKVFDEITEQLSVATNETAFNECMRDKVEESDSQAIELKNVTRLFAVWSLGLLVALFAVCCETQVIRFKKMMRKLIRRLTSKLRKLERHHRKRHGACQVLRQKDLAINCRINTHFHKFPC